MFETVDWVRLFRPDTPLLEIAVRGTFVYFGLFVLLRGLFKREAGQFGLTDLLVIVLIADAAQNAMAGEYKSLTDGALLVAVIVAWAWFIDWISFKVPWLERILKPGKLLLVHRGRLLRRNMARELITEEELRSKLRLEGVADPAEVEAAYMEPDGQISVLRRERD